MLAKANNNSMKVSRRMIDWMETNGMMMSVRSESGLAVQGFLVRPSFDSGLSILDYCLPLPLHLPSPACSSSSSSCPSSYLILSPTAPPRFPLLPAASGTTFPPTGSEAGYTRRSSG